MSRRRIVVGGLVAASLGAALLAVGLLVDPQRAWFAYLVAWTVGVTLAIGALLLLMVGHASKGSWMVVTRRVSEAVAGTLPLYLVLFVPLCFGLAQLYPWVLHPDAHRRRYLDPPFFIGRTVAYFAVFITVATLLRRWSRENDARPRMELVRRMRRLGAGALPVVGLTTTWASFDWTMSLQPEWRSTIFGLYFFAGAFAGAIALVSLMLGLSRAYARPPATLTPDHAQALGRLLLAMISFWAYMAFSQLLIYWIADIPVEITFYARRMTGSWAAVSWLLVVGHFVVPFFALLNRRWKRDPRYLAAVSAWVLAMHFVDVSWLVLPVHDAGGARPDWLDLAAILLVGGVSCVSVTRRYFAAPPLPVHAPDLVEGLDYEAAV
ncbi:MAG TPA: hypothetical protein VHS09_02720 [Polyangiaceae bacterium]|nr:hypothetical protein [Polyangiaceae bacterium]